MKYEVKYLDHISYIREVKDMKVLALVLAAIEQVDFPDDDLEKQTVKYLERLDVELEAVGFSPSAELGNVADDLEEALTQYYSADENKEEQDLDVGEDKEEVEP